MRQPNCGKPRRSVGRPRHSACTIPPHALHIPLRTSRRSRRTACRSAWRSDCCGTSHPQLNGRSLHTRCSRQGSHWGCPCPPCQRNSSRIRSHSRCTRRCSPWRSDPDDGSCRFSFSKNRAIWRARNAFPIHEAYRLMIRNRVIDGP